MSTQNIYDLTDTWNAAGTTFTAVKMNVTDTASAAGSALLDLQIGGVSQFKVSKAGAVTAVGVAIPTISSTSTLTNKTLSSPTISGTVAGSPTFNGAVSFSSDGVVFAHSAGSEGGQYYMAKPVSGTSLTDNLIVDISGNSFRVFEGGGALRGFQIDISACGNVVGTSIVGTDLTQTLSNKTLSGVTIADATNVALATGTGTKIGTATNQKLGFFNSAPVVQPTAVADATGAGDVVAQLNALLSRMRNLGLIAT